MVTDHMNITAHTDSQSETAKVGAVNEAPTNHPYTYWRSEMRGKMELG